MIQKNLLWSLFFVSFFWAEEQNKPSEWPKNLWSLCWNGTWVDFTKAEWLSLEKETQQKYLQNYQQWYAKFVLKTSLEKTILIHQVSFEFILVPPGQYWQGSPESEGGRDDDESLQLTLISKAFWCGKYEVTRQQWSEIVTPDKSDVTDPKKPIERVTWFECQKFCESANVRLLTESEWEYACRAGSSSVFSFGENAKLLNDYANYYDNSEQVRPVGQKKPNAFGLYDMHGSVWEWCSDEYFPERNGEVSFAKNKVYRGGGWDGTADSCRSAERGGLPPEYKNNFLGFRIALSISSQ